jgi:type IV pilus assembly protein PilE
MTTWRQPLPRLHRAGGFTLIELMITVALIAILLATALPSYRSHVRRSLRTEVQAYMVSVMGRQQQYLVDTRAYATNLADIDVPLPGRVAAAYTLKLEVAAGVTRSFVITAAPKADQAYEPCGTMTINQAGSKTAAKAGCW